MTGEEIRQRINENNELIDGAKVSNTFTLNKKIAAAIKENKELRTHYCQHIYENGKCIYCDVEEE